MTNKRLPMGLLAVASIGAFAVATLCVGAVEVSSPAGSFNLKDRARGGQAGVCAEDLAAALKGSLGHDEISKYPALIVNGHRVLISTSSALASVDGKIVKLKQSPAAQDGCLWLSDEFLTAVLPHVLGGPVTLGAPSGDPAAGAEKAPPKRDSDGKVAVSDPRDTVGIEMVVSSDVVRLTLKGKAALTAEVAQGAKEIVVSLPEGAFAGSPSAVGMGIVNEVSFLRGGRKLKVALGPGFKRMESVKLKDPDRLVLVFKGEGQRVAPVPPPSPESATSSPSSAPSGTPGAAPPAEEPRTPASEVTPATGAVSGEAPKKTAAFDVVVLDPGHGGTDSGAITASGLQEKVLTLAIALKTASLLEKEGLRVVLTRSTDTQVPLMQRTAIANFNRADILVSIHLNACPAPSARGTETYFMSRDATDAWASQLASKENAEGPSLEHRPEDGLNLVLWEMAQASVIVESGALAEVVQKEFNDLLKTSDRGIRQAPFVVLEGAQMPAVLVEVAFLTNLEEAKRLTDAAFQDQVASALAKSILAFKARNERPPASTP